MNWVSAGSRAEMLALWMCHLCLPGIEKGREKMFYSCKINKQCNYGKDISKSENEGEGFSL